MILSGDVIGLLPDAGSAEIFETLLERDSVRIERIISKGQVTPVGEWYDQSWNEWVLLLQGEALLLLEGEAEPRRMAPGQWIMLPARCRHRVEWTMPGQETVWLALHWPIDKEREET